MRRIARTHSAKTLSVKIRNRSLVLLPVMAVFLAADLAMPGWGKFPNPVFYGKWALSRTQKYWKDFDDPNTVGDRLKACQDKPQPIESQKDKKTETGPIETNPTFKKTNPNQRATVPNPNQPTITDAQAGLRDTFMGNSSVLVVHQLGTPACQLADGSWRWLLQSGLSLDLEINDQGTVDDATLAL